MLEISTVSKHYRNIVHCILGHLLYLRSDVECVTGPFGALGGLLAAEGDGGVLATVGVRQGDGGVDDGADGDGLVEGEAVGRVDEDGGVVIHVEH